MLHGEERSVGEAGGHKQSHAACDAVAIIAALCMIVFASILILVIMPKRADASARPLLLLQALMSTMRMIVLTSTAFLAIFLNNANASLHSPLCDCA